MAVQFNTFAALLLAFPFYLAQKGRLATYVNLAKPGANTANVSNTGAAASGSGAANSQAVASGSQNPMSQYVSSMYSDASSGLSYMGMADNLLSDVAKIFG